MEVFGILVGVGALAFAGLQASAALGRITLDGWPFVPAGNRAAQWFFASLLTVVGVIAIAIVIAS